MPATRKKQISARLRNPIPINTRQARAIWIAAQRLTELEPFGSGPEAVASAVTHLGYVQIDTINVIERCHHHILYNRIPRYQRTDLAHAQSNGKTVFEYWTHALSYIPVTDLPHFVSAMKAHRKEPVGWGGQVSARDLRRILNRIRDEGPLAISDIKDDKPIEKTHAWGSKKPSKKALQSGFYNGQLVIARRHGMLKTYELTERHFGWEKLPKPATKTQTNLYILERALRAQGLVSLDSICHLIPSQKPTIAALIDREVRAKRLVPVYITDLDGPVHWARPDVLAQTPPAATLTHILSPFDPLIILRKRTAQIFNYDHLFEAYVPKDKRKLGYFTLPVLHGDEIIAALDLKTDRQARKLLIQAWHWVGVGNEKAHKGAVEAALGDFEKFQFGD